MPPRLAFLAGSELFRAGIFVASLILVLIAPFALRPEGAGHFDRAERTLVIVSPHNETIRREFSLAFARHMKEKTGETVRIDWRNVGGTSEISKYLDSSFQAAFEHFWRRELNRRWSRKLGQVVAGAAPERDDPLMKEAREVFLNSDVGIGIDLLFGGGTFDFIRHASRGHLVKSGIFEAEPGWFNEDIIPAEVSGEPLYDPGHRWVGSCLSTFGICYNTDSLERLGVSSPPDQWSDLGDPVYFDEIALADPGKSGSATKAFEMLLQQELAEAIEEVDRARYRGAAAAEEAGLEIGWKRGLNLIQRISANARYFSDNAAKIPYDVAQGNAAAGMCIDFYGRSLSERLRGEDGSSRLQFVTPEGGTSVGADAIAMLRGAPSPDLALEFIRFVLSPEGQRIWHYRPGEEGGPERRALRRMPIRKDAYMPLERVHSSDPDENPYNRARNFTYRPEWTAEHFSMIRLLIQVMCLEPHEELQEAWLALIANDFPPKATEVFFDVRMVGYTNVTGDFSGRLKDGKPLTVQTLRTDLRENFRKNYALAATLAGKGE